eukprot:COSAG06_NODE_42312_length_383_cov_0.531690_1_plen_21_part_10
MPLCLPRYYARVYVQYAPVGG